MSDVLPSLYPEFLCCQECSRGRMAGIFPEASSYMILCRTCGNKRCPKASDHTLTCTNSNLPGQPGSIYKIYPAITNAENEA